MRDSEILNRAVANHITIDPKILKTNTVRLKAYEHYGFSAECLRDPDSTIVVETIAAGIKPTRNMLKHPNPNVRWLTIDHFGWTEGARNDPDSSISIQARRKYGFLIEDIHSEDDFLRYAAKEVFGYIKDDFRDTCNPIRAKAYARLGYTEDALKDDDMHIRRLAKRYFKNKYKNKSGLEKFREQYGVKYV